MIKKYIALYKNELTFCKAFGVKQQFVYLIKKGKRPIPPKLCIALHKVHGAELHELRPDIYPEPE